MSMQVADKSVNNATFGGVLAEERAERPPRTGEGRVRLGNKTRRTLRDIQDSAEEGRGYMQEILDWGKREELYAKGHYDRARIQRLGELNGIVARLALNVGGMERLASDGLVGVYRPQEPDSSIS